MTQENEQPPAEKEAADKEGEQQLPLFLSLSLSLSLFLFLSLFLYKWPSHNEWGVRTL